MSVSSSRSKFLVFLVAVPTLLAGLLMSFTGTAGAWHVDISGSSDCTATVKFNLKSWDLKTKQGSNDAINLDYQVDGGSWTRAGVYKLELSKGNQLDSSFVVPNHTKAMSVVLKASTNSPWGDGSVDSSWTRTSSPIAIPAPCALPSGSLTGVDCIATQSVATLKNDGGTPVEFTVLKDGASAQKITVGAKESKTLNIEVTKTTKITITAPGMATVEKTVTPQTDCLKPVASIKSVCTTGGSGFDVIFKNDGKLTQEFIATIGTKQLDKLTLEAGKSVTKTYKFADNNIAAGKSATVDVTAGGTKIASTVVTNDCSSGTSTIKTVCAPDSGATVTLVNNGKVDETFTVTKDGKTVSTVTLKAGETKDVLVKIDEDTKALVKVTSTNGYNFEQSINIDCVQVAPNVVTKADVVAKPSVLAHTGANVVPMTLAAMMLLALGAMSLRGSKYFEYVGKHFR